MCKNKLLRLLVLLCVLHIVSVYCENLKIEKKDNVSEEIEELSEINEIGESESGSEDIEKNKSGNYPYEDIDIKQNNRTTAAESIHNNNIVNGLDSSIEERFENNIVLNNPYSVAIQKKGSYYATGALIDTQAVLTVARDFMNVRESIKLYKVRLGSVDCKSGGVLLSIKSIHIHPSYVMGKPAFDVAVLKLAEPLNITRDIRPISLSKASQKVISAKFKTTYWPRLLNNGRLLPETAKERFIQRIMRVSMQRLIPWKTCYKLMKFRSAALDETSQCLIPVSVRHSICTPDVGAPVVADDGLWGITSGWTSDDCEIRHSPTIFTRVNLEPIRNWLESMSEDILLTEND